MARYAALLSAVNVGGRKVPMAQLRELLGGLGYTEVQTFLASGNAVFNVPGDAPADASSGTGTQERIGARISDALASSFGFAVPVVVRDGAYLREVIAGCPFPADELEGKQLHATFYAEPVSEERYADIDQAAFLPEEFRLGDRVMYLHLPGGIGRSPLAAALARPASRAKGLVATGRNWNTVKALAELTAAP